jgi:hypothetical protein
LLHWEAKLEGWRLRRKGPPMAVRAQSERFCRRISKETLAPLSSPKWVLNHPWVWQSAFCHDDQIPETINLERGKVCFGPQFQRLQSMVTWPYCFWTSGEAALRGGNMWQSETTYITNQGAKRKAHLLQGHAPSDLTFSH